MTNSNKFWNWLVTSSSDPQTVAMTVKGVMISVVPFLLQFLPVVGIHISADFSSIPDTIYGVVYYGLMIVGGVIAFVGFLRKLWNTFFPTKTI